MDLKASEECSDSHVSSSLSCLHVDFVAVLSVKCLKKVISPALHKCGLFARFD